MAEPAAYPLLAQLSSLFSVEPFSRERERFAVGVPGPSADADGSGPVVLRRAGPGGALHRSGARLRRGLAGAP